MGDDDQVAAEGVALRVPKNGGRPYFWPVTFDRLSAAAKKRALFVLELAGERQQLDRAIDAEVPALRELGLSWGQIGFVCGVTSEGARRRWGGDDD